MSSVPGFRARRPGRALAPLPARTNGPKALKVAIAREKPVAGRASEQGSMYHTWPPECQIQLRGGKSIHHRQVVGLFAQAAARRRRKLAHALAAGVGGMQQ